MKSITTPVLQNLHRSFTGMAGFMRIPHRCSAKHRRILNRCSAKHRRILNRCSVKVKGILHRH
jgi:hypothetical protein